MNCQSLVPLCAASQTVARSLLWGNRMSAQGPDLRLMCERDLVEALERLPIPAFAFDMRTLTVMAANHRFEQLLGYSLEELRSLTAESIRPERDLPSFRATLDTPDSHGFLRARYVRKDGVWLRVKLHYHHLRCTNGADEVVEARMVAVEFWDEIVNRETVSA